MINATAASLLGFLDMCPTSLTGWDLVEQIEQSIGNFWNVTRSQVYRELNTLAAGGLVEAGTTGPRARRPYRITDTGRRAFTEWINREPGPDLLRVPLLLKVFFRDHVDPEKFERFLTKYRLHHQAQLEAYETLEALLEAAPGGPLDTLRLGIAHERALLEWIADLEKRTVGVDAAPKAPPPGK
jgi:DNA-binding PadR family transcriptional regulator